jgi:hypothetical protein
VRDVTQATPIERAMELIAPPADRERQCRRFLSNDIMEIAEAGPPTAKKSKEQLTAAAKALRAALEAVKAMPPFRRFLLLESLQANFLDQLASAASTVALQATRQRVPRDGGRRTDARYRKQEAAWAAWVLLERYGQKRPTLTKDGPFPELASTLYEAATGKRDADLWHQCLVVWRTVEQQRK